MNNKFQELKEQAEINTIDYIPVDLATLRIAKASHFIINRSNSEDIITFTFNQDGLSYLLYTLRNVISPAETEFLYKTDREAFVNAVVQARFEQLKIRQTTRIFAIDIHQVVHSVLTNYVPISDIELVHSINAAGLSENVNNFRQSLQRTHVFIESAHKVDSVYDFDMKFGISIVNGQTGVTSFGYRIWINIDDYTLELPHAGKTRHQGDGVVSVFKDATSALEEAAAIEWWENQKTIGNKAEPLLNEMFGEGKISEKRFDVLSSVLGAVDTNAKAIITLTQFSDRHGFKTIANKLMKAITE